MHYETRPYLSAHDDQGSTETLSADALLRAYGIESSFFFATPSSTWLGRGILANLSIQPSTPLDEALTRMFGQAQERGVQRPVAVGALPFDPEAAPILYIPERLERAGRRRHAPPATIERALSGCTAQEFPPADVYAASVREALTLMQETALKKVVLSRTLEVVGECDIDQARLLHNLAYRNPTGYTFAVNLPPTLRDLTPRRLIGASPELLVRRTGARVLANPIAGTAPRSADPAVDRARAEALLRSAKDRHEHALVVEAVIDALRPYCRIIDCPPAPELISTARLWHLSTRVRGELRDPAATSIELARALHPTPAVCGEPRALARAAIERLESFSRGFFTGLVGWCDAEGDGEWAVTIRCAEVEGPCARLYAGAGIVQDSDPWLEVAETAAKFRTLLDALTGGSA
ncbi:isochorismate synthase [Methylocaldum szegediense]|uniref:isochorismate synthase n=1 Tax=Methylocaldum szegediense TaxID=73780 RepID=A0ABM9HW16_9GAMM|nr:isochorismate synthase [Methylocaldum szegediense]CAI8723891.1 Isochorismate synthase DhbC [Methylocaldum szegediense]